MSEEVEAALMGLRKFMFENVYRNPLAKSEEEKAIKLVQNLYEYYSEHFEKLPEPELQRAVLRGDGKEQIICDYIAGMTDNYAVKKVSGNFLCRNLGKFKGKSKRICRISINVG